MSHFVVSFRIEKNSTYQDRYDSLRDKVHQMAKGYVWDETTSLYVFEAAGTASSVAWTLYYQTKLLAPGDAILVIDPVQSQWAGYGLNYPALLGSAMGIAQTT